MPRGVALALNGKRGSLGANLRADEAPLDNLSERPREECLTVIDYLPVALRLTTAA
jgi:hypothetical protein